MARPVFEKKVIGEVVNDTGRGQMNLLGCVGDFNGDGVLDFATCGRNGEMVWFENRGESEVWQKHHIAGVSSLECGGHAYDLTGNGCPDILNGSDSSMDEMCWWENPGRPGTPWQKHLIAKTGRNQMHDTLIGALKNDGVPYLVFTNQGSGTTVYCVPIPEDPFQAPWPDLEIIASGKSLPNPRHTWSRLGIQPDEGLALGDVDNDGLLELVSGVSYYKWTGGGWEENRFTDQNYITNKIAVADVDGDGRNEIILCEGDAYIYGHDEGCKLAYFKPDGEDYRGLWAEHVIDTGLLDAHSIAVADLCGNGRADLFVAEIGAAPRDASSEDYIIRQPRLMIYENDGRGNYPTRYIIDEGTGTHEATLEDLNGDGKLDIIGKPLHGPEKWKIHVWYNRSV